MRLLLLESEPANISRIQSIFSFPITVDHTPSLAQARSITAKQEVEALIFCHLEWLPTLQEFSWKIPLVFLPLGPRELRKIASLSAGDFTLKFARLRLYPSRHQVKVGQKEIFLPKTEYTLLQYFLKYPETTLQYSFLIQHTWLGWHQPKLNTLHRHISNLRRRLGGQSPKLRIQTVSGVGYRLEGL